jgi:hypothetical protein
MQGRRKVLFSLQYSHKLQRKQATLTGAEDKMKGDICLRSYNSCAEDKNSHALRPDASLLPPFI